MKLEDKTITYSELRSLIEEVHTKYKEHAGRLTANMAGIVLQDLRVEALYLLSAKGFEEDET